MAWLVHQRPAGHGKALRVAYLPVYRPCGDIRKQVHVIHPFREVDGKPSYCASLNANIGQGLELALFHDDNRANPLSVHKGQCGWRTRFNHLSAIWCWRCLNIDAT